jgi:hypothetical protein
MIKPHVLLTVLLGTGLLPNAGVAGEGTSLKQDAKELGRDVRATVHDAGREVKKAGKEVGKAVGQAARETGRAVRDGAKELKQGLKGEDASTASETTAKPSTANRPSNPK